MLGVFTVAEMTFDDLRDLMGSHWDWLPLSYWKSYYSFASQSESSASLKTVAANVVVSVTRQSDQDVNNSLNQLQARGARGLKNYLLGLINEKAGNRDQALALFQSAAPIVDKHIRALIEEAECRLTKSTPEVRRTRNAMASEETCFIENDGPKLDQVSCQLKDCQQVFGDKVDELQKVSSERSLSDEGALSILDIVEIKIVNLKSRVDRWDGIQAHLVDLGFEDVDQMRFDAIGVDGFGELGCTRSHLLALTEFLCRSDKPFVMILEDDFRFKGLSADIAKAISWFVHDSDGDVFMMNCSCAITQPQPEVIANKFRVNRVLSSNSMAGFIVRRNHVREVIHALIESLRSHESIGSIYLDLKAKGNREQFRPILNMICNDRVWVKLQTSCRYLSLTPSIGSTIASYSDIEACHVDYRIMENQ